MEDARWFTRAELLSAVADASDISLHPYTTGQLPEVGYFIPPPIAIAHHLIRQWAQMRQTSTAKL